MAKISRKQRKRLEDLFAMLGTNNPNEWKIARDKLDDLLRKNRKSWNDLVELLRTGEADSSWDFEDPDRDPDSTVPAPASDGNGDINIADHVLRILKTYLDMRPYEFIAVTLWILHCYVARSFSHTPRLMLLSPVPDCGKTTVLGIIQRLLPHCEKSDDMTAAALCSAIEE
jgi:hypothetical protein